MEGNRLGKYILKRIIQTIPVLLAVILINFTLVHLAPGDVAVYYSDQEAPSLEEIEATRRRFGLDQPLWIQIIKYFERLIRLDFGYSWKWERPVLEVIGWRLPMTILLMLTSFVFSLVIGIVAGTYAARKQGTKLDTLSSITFLTLYSTPTFWGALILIYFFALNLKMFPTSGVVYIGREMGLLYYWEILRHLFLPALSLSAFSMLGTFFRITRSSVIEVMNEDFVTTAEAVGYEENTVFFRHVLRNALLPIITMAGFQIGVMFTGAMITETVFSWPGMGRLTYEAILSRDIPLIIGSYIIGSLFVILSNLVVDILYTFVDPRVKIM